MQGEKRTTPRPLVSAPKTLKQTQAGARAFALNKALSFNDYTAFNY